ncbi:MAG: PhnD/SsuA/transferrin family substrate-binding protein [Myxococcota bacterium]
MQAYAHRAVGGGLITRRTAAAGLALLLGGCRRPVPGRERPLLVVFGPRHGPENAELLRTRLESSSKLKLEFHLAKSSDEAIDLVQSGRADAALLSLFDYFFCAGIFDVEPLVQVVRHGAATQASELLVPAQSSVREVAELRGQRVGYVDRYSVTGFLLPAAHLGKAGVTVEPVWLGTHDAVLTAVQEGRVAAGASYAGHGATVTGLRVLATLAPIANEPVFVQRALPSDVREALKGAWLAEQDAKSLAGLADATGFRAAPAQAFEEALSTLKAAGLQVEDTLEGGWLRANEHRRPAWSYGP